MKQDPMLLPFINLTCTLIGLFYFVSDKDIHPIMKIVVIIAICSVACILLVLPTSKKPPIYKKKLKILLILLCGVATISMLFVVLTWNLFIPDTTKPEATIAIDSTIEIQETPQKTISTPMTAAPTIFVTSTASIMPTPEPPPTTSAGLSVVVFTPAPSPSPEYSQKTIDTFDAGYINYSHENYGSAFRLLLEAANDGYPKAQQYVGLCYQEGHGVIKNSFKAFDWFCMSAEQGYDVAQYSVGYCYHIGFGVRQDDSRAFEWFKKAAEQKNELGLLWTGYCYHYGVGVERDYDLAEEYYSAAVELGNTKAMNRLVDLHRDRGY